MPLYDAKYQHQILYLRKPLPFDKKKFPYASNPVSQSELLCLSRLTFLVNLRAPNKRFSNLKSTSSKIYLM